MIDYWMARVELLSLFGFALWLLYHQVSTVRRRARDAAARREAAKAAPPDPSDRRE